MFAKLHARYGSKFSGQYPEDLWPYVQREWLDLLSWASADDIQRGLDVWREAWPPCVIEFIVACKPLKQIAAYKTYAYISPIRAESETAKRNINKIREMIKGAQIITGDK